jgi:hypothetical protein
VAGGVAGQLGGLVLALVGVAAGIVLVSRKG